MSKAKVPNPVVSISSKRPVAGIAMDLRLVLSALAFLSFLLPEACGHPPATSPIGRTDPGHSWVLKGTWERPDGGYLLRISSVADTGEMEASYFNPRPIHVARAKTFRSEGRLKAIIELRDENYPGSTYYLTYDPANDRLQGSYYQAVAHEIYQISFVRVTP